jgi:hypothetical protein
MRILFFALTLVIFLMIVTPLINSSFANPEKSIAEYSKEIKPNVFPSKDTTKAKFEDKNSDEKHYKYTRAWNATMYKEFKDQDTVLPHNWWTGITLYRIGEINPVTGTYELDFNYWIQIFEDKDKTDFTDVIVNGETTKSFSIDFVNSVDIELEESKGIKHKPHYYDAMVNGEFYSKMDFKKFPFETLKLQIIVEPGHNEYYDNIFNNTIQFQRWPYPVLFSEGVPSPEYEIKNYAISINDHRYSEGDTFSRYTAEFEIQRNVYGAFLKFIFPIIVMASLAGAALIFPSQEYMTKIELNAIFLLGILFFVQVVVEEMPATGEITIFDTVVIMGYLVIIVTMAIPAAKWWKRRKFETDDEDYEEWKDQDRRYHDLHVEKLKSIQLRMTFLVEKIGLLESKEEVKQAKEEIKLLEKLRIQVLNLKRLEEDMTTMASADDDEIMKADTIKEEDLKGLNAKWKIQVELEIERKKQIESINDIEIIIKNNTSLVEVKEYDRKKFFDNVDIFKNKPYFEDFKQLKIVSWGYADADKKISDFNVKMNLVGLGLIILISGIGYAWINSMFTG